MPEQSRLSLLALLIALAGATLAYRAGFPGALILGASAGLLVLLLFSSLRLAFIKRNGYPASIADRGRALPVIFTGIVAAVTSFAASQHLLRSLGAGGLAGLFLWLLSRGSQRVRSH